MNYLFQTERLGFRNWLPTDQESFAEMNADPDVMAHFPSPLSTQETTALIERLQNHYEQYGYTYYAVDELKSGEFIGFIGMAYKTYPAEFTPVMDIGWRLKKSAWGKGFATEGAKKCLDIAFNDLKTDRIIATCTADNTASENVMKKIGLTYQGIFKHPFLKDYPNLEACCYYEMRLN